MVDWLLALMDASDESIPQPERPIGPQRGPEWPAAPIVNPSGRGSGGPGTRGRHDKLGIEVDAVLGLKDLDAHGQQTGARASGRSRTGASPVRTWAAASGVSPSA